jgi:DNA-binding MarR family transcriptional regulator
MTTEQSDASSRGLSREIQLLLRELTSSLHHLNDVVGGRVDLRATDIEVLDLVARHGPMSPGELSTTTGIHPATLTGIIDRLEDGGWMRRAPDSDDRRRVRLEAVWERGGELARLYGPMNRAITALCAELGSEQLTVIRDFLRAISTAGAEAATRIEKGGR